MKPIHVLLKVPNRDNDTGYVNCQVVLSQDVIGNKGDSTPTESSKPLAKIFENNTEMTPYKEGNSKTTTPNRTNRTLSMESNDIKTDCKTKDTCSSKEGVENKTGVNSIIESPLRKSHETLDQSFKEEQGDDGNFSVVMQTIFMENRHLFKKSLTNKIFEIEVVNATLVEYLKSNSCKVKGCRIWECTYEGSISNHFETKYHKKVRDELGLKEQEDLLLSPIKLVSTPGSIEDELHKLRESEMKTKYRKLKQQMLNKGVSHEVASAYGKDITSASNKKKMQILSMELENKVTPTITEYSQLESKLNSLISLLARKRQEELHLLRKLKIIPWVTEICKKIAVCPRNEIKDLVRSIELAIQIFLIFVAIKENRDYMLSTNRVLFLTELLIWTLNKPMHLFFGSTYVPQLFEVITICLKHRAPYSNQQMKVLLLEYILCSPIIKKLKGKFESVVAPLHLTGKLSLIPAIIWKGLSFLEVITSIVGMDSRYRPVYDRSQTINTSMYFIIDKTKMMYIIPLMLDVLFEKAQHPKEILPKSILNLTYISLKTINNMFRINLALCQEILSDQVLMDQFYYVLNYIVKYCYLFEDQNESKDILYETLIMIGYYTLLNQPAQKKIRSGENSVIQKLWQLDISFFMEKQKKDILFPTLICMSYKDDINVDIIDEEMDRDYLKKYIRNTRKEEMYNIPEDEREQKSMDSSSIWSMVSSNSSTTSITTNLKMEQCPFIPFSMRFPKHLLEEALEFYSN